MSMSRKRLAALIALVCAATIVAGGCSCGDQTQQLHGLASTELSDMQPILNELRQDTGVELVLDFKGTVDSANALEPGQYQYDLAWLSSDRYFQLKLKASGFT